MGAQGFRGSELDGLRLRQILRLLERTSSAGKVLFDCLVFLIGNLERGANLARGAASVNRLSDALELSVEALHTQERDDLRHGR